MTSRPPASKQFWVAAIALFLIILPLNYILLLKLPPGKQILGVGDSARYFAPNTFFLDQSLHNRQWPLWNPFTFCGNPFAANPQSQVLYPPHLLRALLLPNPTPLRSIISLRIETLLHTLMAFCATLALARKQRLSTHAALIAAFTFAFGASAIRCAMGPWILLASAAWLPLILLAGHAAFQAPSLRSSARYALLAGALLAMSALAGAIQVVIYNTVFLSVYLLLLLIVRPPSLDHAHTLSRPNQAARAAQVLLIIGAATALGAAVLLIPAAQFSSLSTRAAQVGPAVHYRVTTGLRLWPLHIHAGFLLLALLAILARQRRGPLLWALLTLLLLDLWTGAPTPIDSLLRALCPFQLSSPNRAAILLPLPLGMLAAHGWDALTQQPPNAHRRLTALAIAITGLAVLALYAIWPYCPRPQSIIPYLASLAAIAAITTATLTTLNPPAVKQILLPLLLAEVILWNAVVFHQGISRSPFDPSMQFFEQQQPAPSLNQRIAADSPNTNLFTTTPVINGYDPVQLKAAMAIIAPPNQQDNYYRSLNPEDITAKNPWATLLLKRPFWLARQFVNDAPPPERPLFPVTTTVFLHDSPQLPVPCVDFATLPTNGLSPSTRARSLNLPRFRRTRGGPFRFKLGPLNIPKRHTALAIKYISNHPGDITLYLRKPGEEATLWQQQAHLEPSKRGQLASVYIPLPAFSPVDIHVYVKPGRTHGIIYITQAHLIEDFADEDHLIHIQSLRPNRVDLEIGPLKDHRILTYTDAYYPGWQARIDGKPAPIHLAYGAFKAVHIPPGTHQVTFLFRPKALYIGALISLTTAALIAAIWMAHAITRKPHPQA